MIHLIKKNIYPTLLFLLVGILALLNYTPGTFVTGWDNLQTDLAPMLGVKRALFSVWQEYQSFGLTAGMAHAADLVRSVFVLALSFIVRQSDIRFVFHFLMVLTGGLGAFALSKELEFVKKPIYAFIMACFYILNLGTLQILFLPFESFTIFFALLPWEIWAFVRLMKAETPTRNQWLTFFIINLLATSQAVAQQLFVVYGIVLAVFSVPFLARLENIAHFEGKSQLKKQLISTIRRLVAAAALIIAINSFWILPQLYFLYNNGDIVVTSKMNQLVSEDVFYNNLEKGNPDDFFTLNNFFFDRRGIDQKPLFEAWKVHREKEFVKPIVFLFAIIPLIGLVYVFLKKSRYRYTYLILGLVVATALMMNAYFFDTINELIRQNAFVNQIFRSPFTKFVIPYSILISMLFALGVEAITKIVSFSTIKVANNKKVILFVFIFLLLVYAFPAFRGEYLSRDMRVALPGEYLEIIEHFNTIDKNKRIALLPEYTHWGWEYHSWGYNGSGFLWYGIEQPIVSRTFDVWSTESEGYFWEMKHAIEAEDVEQFDSILEKYAIDFLLFDESLQPITSSAKSLQYNQTKAMLQNSLRASPYLTGNYVTVYEVKHDQTPENFIALYSKMPVVAPYTNATNEDRAYRVFGPYVTSDAGAEGYRSGSAGADSKKKYTANAYYPFTNLFSQTRHLIPEWKLNETEENFILLSPNVSNVTSTDSFSNLDFSATLFKNNEEVTYSGKLGVAVDSEKTTATFTKVPIDQIDLNSAVVNECGTSENSSAFPFESAVAPVNGNNTEDETGTNSTGNTANTGSSLHIRSNNKSTPCISFDLPHLDQSYAYLVKVKNKNVLGRRLFMSITDHTKNQVYIEERLHKDIEYFIVTNRFNYGLGYTLAFQNNSYINLPSENYLDSVDVYLLPYDRLKAIRIGDGAPTAEPLTNDLHVTKHKYFLYSMPYPDVAREKLDMAVLHLNQAYDNGWQAYVVNVPTIPNRIRNVSYYFPFLGAKIDGHVRVNNWANGWILERPAPGYVTDKTHIVMIFWPQYVQFLGFGVLILALIRILRISEHE